MVTKPDLPPLGLLAPIVGIMLVIKVAQHCDNLGLLKVTEQVYHYHRQHPLKAMMPHLFMKERPAPD